MELYVLLVFMKFSDQESCHLAAKKYYPNEKVECTMFIDHLPRAMPPPLNRPEMWSCEKRPKLCLKD